MRTDAQKEHSAAGHAENAIHLPAPTAWPLIMAVGLTLLFAGACHQRDDLGVGRSDGHHRRSGVVSPGVAA